MHLGTVSLVAARLLVPSVSVGRRRLVAGCADARGRRWPRAADCRRSGYRKLLLEVELLGAAPIIEEQS